MKQATYILGKIKRVKSPFNEQTTVQRLVLEDDSKIRDWYQDESVMSDINIAADQRIILA
jgi:hypothetical protein